MSAISPPNSTPLPPAADEPRRKPATRTHPLRRLRIERWTWTHAALAAVIAALGVIATLPAWTEIHFLAWNDAEYSHIFLVPIVVTWMVFARRQRIRHCKPIGTLLGFIVAGLGAALYLFGYYRGFSAIYHAGAVMVVLGCVLTILGKHALFRFLPAVFVLLFAIPVPPHLRLKIALPLQSWTAEVSQMVLEQIGVPVERQGNNLRITAPEPAAKTKDGVATSTGEDRRRGVAIAEACNGLRMVFALIMISYAFSFGLPLRNSVRFIVLIASPIIAIICNVVRIVPSSLLFFYSSNEIGEAFHNLAGWLMLPVSFVILLGVIRVLRWANVPVMKYSLAS